MDRLTTSALMFEFVEESNSHTIEMFALYIMPMEFAMHYLHRRLHRTTKESFRLSFLYYLGGGVGGEVANRISGSNGRVTTGPEVAVVDFVRTHGSFEISQLARALGHQPSKQEVEDVQQFLSTMTDKLWQKVLRDNNKHY